MHLNASLRAPGLAFGEPKGKLREAVSATQSELAVRDCFASLAMTGVALGAWLCAGFTGFLNPIPGGGRALASSRPL